MSLTDSLGFRGIRDTEWKTMLAEGKRRCNGNQPAGDGDGIVIIGGGKYSQWTLLNVSHLRYTGFSGPIEVWALNERETPQDWLSRLSKHDVRVRYVSDIQKIHPTLLVSGWHMKIYAALYCDFHNVLILDSDSIPEPAGLALFESDTFKDTGAVFTRDIKRCHKSPLPYHIAGLKAPWEKQEHEFETGFMLINRVRHHRALRFVHWIQEHSPYWWRLLHGDKGTTEIGWRYMNASYTLTQDCSWEGWGIEHRMDGQTISRHMMAAKRGEARMPVDMGRYEALVSV